MGQLFNGVTDGVAAPFNSFVTETNLDPLIVSLLVAKWLEYWCASLSVGVQVQLLVILPIKLICSDTLNTYVHYTLPSCQLEDTCINI